MQCFFRFPGRHPLMSKWRSIMGERAKSCLWQVFAKRDAERHGFFGARLRFANKKSMCSVSRRRCTANAVLFLFSGAPPAKRTWLCAPQRTESSSHSPRRATPAREAAASVRILAAGEIPGAREEQAPPLPLTLRPFYAIMKQTTRKAVER